MAAYTTIDDPSAHFQTLVYTGNGSNPRNLTNDGNSDLKPDWIWGKNRTDNGTDHILTNTTLGLNPPITDSLLSSNSTGGVNTPNPTYGYVSAMLTDGFTAVAGGTNGDNFNANSKEFVAWQWKANGGTTATNTTGNGIDSVVQANTTAGFSIVTYTGNGTQSGQTVGHGLGAVPKMIISKDRTNSSNVVSWRVYHVGIGPTKYIELQSTAAESTFNDWDDTAPTSSVYSVGGAGGYTPTNTNNALYVAYCFAEIQGYSKFGKYVGNGNADGPFVYTGFKPAFLMMKESSSAGGNWVIFDNKRDVDNVLIHRLHPNTTAGDNTSRNYIDFYSNGFKMRNTDADHNQSGQTMIYMAVAENPFVTSTGIPTTAR